MKSPAAYYLILLYATMMFKPLIPIIGDIWSHEFNNIEHISLVHAKYGSHHMQKEVAKSGNDKSDHNTQKSLSSVDEVSFHFINTPHDNLPFEVSLKLRFSSFNTPEYSSAIILQQGPPPKQSC